MDIPLEEITFEASRASGPGGQHVQKTSSRITLRWSVLESLVLNDHAKERIIDKLASRINKKQELIIHVESHRSQHRNKSVAHKLLNSLVSEALKIPKARKKTRPKKSAIERRLQEKSQVSHKKASRSQDFRNE